MIVRSAIAILVVMSCAHAPSPAPCPTPTETAVPAADAGVAKWQAIAADHARVPAGSSAAALLPELEAYLASPDPVRRDTIGYDVVSTWIAEGTLADADVRALADRLVRNLGAIDPRPNTVFGRSFSALVLASIVRRDAKQPCLDDAGRHAILAAARAYADREPDLRGHTGAMGWAHAAAHTADLLAQLAKHPALTPADRAIVLDAVAAWVVRPHGMVLAYGEDGRLAVAVVLAAKTGLAPDALAAFLTKVKAPLLVKFTPAFDAATFAAYRNARNLLFSIYVQASLLPEPGEGEKKLVEAVRSALAD